MVLHAPIPPDEAARLAALRSYEILDTAPDDRFDLFTRLGTWLFQLPVCAVNLVDEDRTFFKSLIGFPSYVPQRCTSICAHAISVGESIMEVEDLSRDPRFHDHPLFTSKGIRFYAGALLRSDDGYAIGTLCMGDVQPRVLSAEERERLAQLAHGVGAILELHRCGVRLLDAATRDVLTGICNRRGFEKELLRATDAAPPGASCALLYLDLDGFKQINDTLGHAAGDAVLCEVGRRLTGAARRGDVAARLAGDEFVLLIQGPIDEAVTEHVARRLLDALAAPFELHGRHLPLRASIGIARRPDHALDAAALLHCADSALYEAKRNGGGGFSTCKSRAPGFADHAA